MFFDRGPTRDPAPRLYIPNVDNGLELSDFVTGATGAKARQVQTRFLHYCDENDGLVVSRQISDDYLEYVKKLYSYSRSPHVFYAPNRNLNNPEVPFAILHDILCNQRLVKDLKIKGHDLQWEVTPFISHRWAHWLGKRIELSVHGVSHERVKSGHVGYFNDKAHFRTCCLSMNIPVPPGVIARGWNDVLEKAALKSRKYGDIILRVSKSGGGYGLCIVKSADVAVSGLSVQEYITQAVPEVSRTSWSEQEVLVEEYLAKKSSPSTLVYITEHEIIRVVDTNQILDENDHFLGASIPSGLDPLQLEILWLYTERLARYVQENGGRGFYGVDWGILQDNSIVAFEPNYRFTGNWHIMCIRKRLNVGDYAITIHKDKMLLAPHVTFKNLLEVLNTTGIAWDHERRDGVVVTIPPDGEIFGFVCIATGRARARELFCMIEHYAKSTFKKSA